MRHRTACDVAALIIVLLFFLNLSWVGYLGSDDAFYLRGAQGTLGHFPYLGVDHWELRYPIVVPIAISIGILGVGEFSLSLPSMAYLLALIITTYFFFRSRIGWPWAMLLGSLVAAAPIFSLKFTTAAVEAPEVFFTAISLMAFVKAGESPNDTKWLILSGVLAAIAFASRETALSLVLTFIVLFAIGYGGNRWRYFIVGGSFVAMTVIEYLYLWALSGNPLYRLQTDVGHDLVDRQSVVVEGVDAAGNISVGGILDPFLVVFANQEFGLLFIVGVFALVTWRQVTNSDRGAGIIAVPFMVLALCNFLLVSALSKNLYLEPRYFSAAAFAMLVITVLWLRCLTRSNARAAGAVVSILLVSLVAGSLVDNKDYFFAERALVQLARSSDEVIYTDPSTAHRSQFLLQSYGAAESVVGDVAPTGALYLHVAKNLVQRREAKKWFDAAMFEPEPGWEVVAIVDPPKRLVGRTATLLRLDRVLPNRVAKKLIQPNQPAVLYRVTAGKSELPEPSQT